MSTDSDIPDVASDLTDIAIIAMQCRFAGAANVDEYWSLLTEKREGARFLDGLADSPGLVRRDAGIDGIDLFDADFFGYLPADAAIIDPQQRVFLECAYHVFEQAGYDPDRYDGLVGVYAGSGQPNYHIANVLPRLGIDPSSADALPVAFSNTASSLPTRVSYHLNLTGPSLAVDTACSTSLVAVHVACQELLDYRCDLGLAGGVTLNPSPGEGYEYVLDGPLSPDGRCRAFDADAAGMFPGDGVGVVLLKRLADALADGDRIRAVIKGSAINNDGRRKAGFVAPSVAGQSEVILAAHAAAGVDADTIGMVEAHGTGTPVGDPIEVAALTNAFRESTDRIGYCLLGSAKTNVGHTDAAAGVAGLIKAVLSLEHGVIPANLHYRAANPMLDLDSSPFRVADDTVAWPRQVGPRRAGVSAFGIGGTNAHVVLEQAPPVEVQHLSVTPPVTESLLVLSAASASALDRQATRLAEHLRGLQDADLADVADTLQFGRRALPYRRSLVCESVAQAATRLAEPADATRAGSSVPLVMLLPGGGSQYVGMGRELYETEDVFRTAIDRCAQILARRCDIDLLDHLYRDGGLDEQRLDVVFPAVLAIEYALADQLTSWGLTPSAMMGHSLGEYAAACLAGVLDIDDALPLVSVRGRLFAQTSGATISVLSQADDIAPLCTGRLVISGITTATTCTVSGPVAEIGALEEELVSRGVQFQRVRVALAAHSPELDEVLSEFADVLAAITLRPPRIPYLSNVTGTWIRPEEATDPAYWVRHSREPVQLASGFDELAKMTDAVLVEVGPGRTLTRLAALHHDAVSGTSGPTATISTMRHPDDDHGDRHALLAAVGAAWDHGVGIDWSAVSGRRRPGRISLPDYPFERQPHWITPPDRTHQPEARPAAASIPVWRSSTPTTPSAASAPRRTLLLAGDDPETRQLATEVAELIGPDCDLPASAPTSVQGYESVVFFADGVASTPDQERYTRLAALLDSTDSVVAVCICVRNAFDVTGNEDLDVAQWPAVGAAEWLRRHSNARSVDVLDVDRADAGLVVAELALPASGTLAYRNGRRWVCDSEPIEEGGARWSDAGAALSADPIRFAIEQDDAPASNPLDELCTRYVCAYLNDAGVALTSGTEFSRDELIDRLHVVDEYHKIVGALIRILSEWGIVENVGDRWRVLDVAVPTEVPDLAQWSTEHPELAAQAQLLDQCVRGYPAVLSGRLTGNEVVMPGGDDSLYRTIIEQRAADSDFSIFSDLISSVLVRLAADADASRPLRILELGAGRGYLTWPVAEALRAAPSGAVEFYFTDIGRSFVVAGQQRAEADGLDFLRFATLDITADPAGEPLPLEAFDVVLAFNVLHVAPDLRAGIRNVAEFIAPGGLLCLLEAKKEERCDSLIDPLMSGWLDFNDDLRTDSPLVAPELWTRLLTENGFTGASAHDSGPAGSHALIIAQRPEPLRVLDSDYALASAAVDEISASRASTRRALLTGPGDGDDSITAALAAGYARGAIVARHRSGICDWTFVDTTNYRADERPTDRFAQVLSGPATPEAVLGTPTAAQPGVDSAPETTTPDPTPSEESSFNQRPALSTQYCAPRTEMEERIAAIWQRYFGYDRIGVNDQFLELGGESLLAMQIAAEQRKTLGIETSMRALLETGTVAGIAAVAATPSGPAVPAEPAAPPRRRGRAARRAADGTIVIEGARA